MSQLRVAHATVHACGRGVRGTGNGGKRSGWTVKNRFRSAAEGVSVVSTGFDFIPNGPDEIHPTDRSARSGIFLRDCVAPSLAILTPTICSSRILDIVVMEDRGEIVSSPEIGNSSGTDNLSRLANRPIN